MFYLETSEATNSSSINPPDDTNVEITSANATDASTKGLSSFLSPFYSDMSSGNFRREMTDHFDMVI